MWPFSRKPNPSSGKNTSKVLWFKSGKDALEFYQKSFDCVIKEGEPQIGLLGDVRFQDGALIANILVPNGDHFEEVRCMTTLKSCEDAINGSREITSRSSLSEIGLKTGDLVMIMVSHAPELRPYTEWLGFLIARLEPAYDIEQRGWKIDRKYQF